tara:strand:+ start:247 stop:639 length:393 start_codon:yes stop_codon:yes gene_type:complete
MIGIRNFTNWEISEKQLMGLAELVLKKEKKKDKDLSVVFVGQGKMREFNKSYRGKDEATNVLSFPGGEFSLGEIVLCPSVIKKDALEYKISFQGAISWMFVHGLLHLLGYDHKTAKAGKAMSQKEQRYLS